MAKSQLFKRPLQFIFSHGGVFPILRGRRDEEAFKTAHAVLERANLVVMYAEGGRSRTQELGEPKPGVGRLALETGVPVVPVAIAGSAKVRNWKRLQFPKVTVQYGDPVRFERGSRAHSRAGPGRVEGRLRADQGLVRRPAAGRAPPCGAGGSRGAGGAPRARPRPRAGGR